MAFLSHSAADMSKFFFYSIPKPTISRLNCNDRLIGCPRVIRTFGVKNREYPRADLVDCAKLQGQFSSPVKSKSYKEDEDDEEEKRNYYINMGYAIRTLREEFPSLFHKELTLDIYRDDIVLKDPINTFHGIENYKSILWALRFYGRMFFRALWIDIISVWQPADNVIMIRWTVHGVPRVPWESRGRFDGTSEYKLDKDGKIFQHKVDNIALNSPPKFRVLAVAELIRSIGCSSTPKPTYFEVSLTSFHRN